MDRGRMIGHLKALINSEERLARNPRPYLDKSAQRAAEQMHWNNVQALRQAVDELEDTTPLDKQGTPCPAPLQELDEFRCTRCAMRWDYKEEKPPCPITK